MPTVQRPNALAALALLALTVFFYLPALRAGYVWDDNHYLTDNTLLHSVAGLKRIWFEPASTIQYYPMVFTSFWIEHHLWGLNPIGYHLNNVLLHAANSILVWLLLRELKVPGAWLGGLLFALHPVHVESVAWIAERKDVLSGLFFFLTLLAWVRWLQQRRIKYYLGSLLLFALALLSKATTAPLCALLPLLIWWKGKAFQRRNYLWVIPFVAMGLLMSIGYSMLEKKNIAGSPGQYDRTIVESSLIAGRALWFYAGKLLAPWPLMTIYPKWEMRAGNPAHYIYLLLAVALPVLCYLLRRRWGMGPFVAVCYFGLMLAPALGFIPGGFFRLSFVSDHFQYLASAGPLAVFSALCAGWAKLPPSPERDRLKLVALALIILALGSMTWAQCGVYRDSQTLWAHNTRLNPEAPFPHHALGNALAREGRMEDALRSYMRAVEHDPAFWQARQDLAEVLRSQGKFAEAALQEEEVLRLRPDNVQARIGLAVALGRMGRPAEAEVHLQSVLKSMPESAPNRPDVFNLLGITQARMMQREKAIASFIEALRLRPNFPDARRNLENAQKLKAQ